jgi:hypothetical protein
MYDQYVFHLSWFAFLLPHFSSWLFFILFGIFFGTTTMAPRNATKPSKKATAKGAKKMAIIRGEGTRAGSGCTHPNAPKQAPTKAALVIPAGATKNASPTRAGED